MLHEKFLQIADLLNDAICLVTPDGVIQAANRAARNTLGLHNSSDAKARLLEFVDGEADSLATYLRSCARSREPLMTTFRTRGKDPAATLRCRGAMLSPRSDETPAIVMLTLTSNSASTEPFAMLNQKLDELNHEIERRKRSEEALRQHLQLSEFGREFGLALTKVGTLDEILRRCTDLMVQYLGASFARIWVMQEDNQALVLRASSGLYTHLDGGHSRVPVGQLKIGLIAQSQQPHLTNQVIGDPRVNEQAWAAREGMVAFAGYPLIVDGATIGVMAIFAKHELPQAVISTMGSVATQLAIGISRKETEDALTRKAVALELANTRKNEFLAMLSHELRNPLAPIRSGLDLLQGEQPENDLIPVMQDNVEYMVRIVDDLLDVSRIMRGRIEMRKQPVRMKQIVERSLTTIRSIAENAKHQLQVADVPEALWVNGDEIRLTQVVTNLLHNAVKYTPDGGRIQVDVECVKDRILLRIADTGIGIDPAFAPELFTLFAQATRSLDRSQGGLGIGLTLVKQIVSLHGGQVEASSDGVGRGSLFTIQLPRADPPTDGVDLPTLGDTGQVPSYRILVVDDNVASAKILARLLEKNWKHEIAIEFDGAKAIETAATWCPQIIFLDIGLPGISGFEVAKTLRSKPQHTNAFFVALTGYGTDEDRKASAAAGFNMHLVKPISLDDLRCVFEMVADVSDG